MPKKKPAKPAKKTTKKAFDLSRDSVYTAEPITELRICGAAGVVEEDEAGDLDTRPGPDVPVKDQKRIARPLKPGLKANIAQNGVNTPITIAKIDDVATVIVGKGRVRAARAANRQRLTEGRPLIKIRCVMLRDTSVRSIQGAIIRENNAREDDDLADRIEKLKAYLGDGASEEDAATEFGVKKSTILGWLAYEDHATEQTKKAVGDGRVPASTAAELAKIKDPDEQRKALDKLLVAPGTKQRSARAARALRRGANGDATATDRNSQALLLSKVEEMIKTGDLDDVYSEDVRFWHGVYQALRLVTGNKDADDRLVKILAEARA